jgi:hypothetical protein
MMIEMDSDELDRLHQLLLDASYEIARLRALVLLGVAVVEDFMPNIGSCALQDYGRLNNFLIESAKVARAG